MIRTGAVYGNLMVNVKPTNDKLIERAHCIIMAAAAPVRPIDRFAASHPSSKAAASRPPSPCISSASAVNVPKPASPPPTATLSRALHSAA
jgi:hypothetical protein